MLTSQAVDIINRDKTHKLMPLAKCYYVLWKYVCICVGLFACVYVYGPVCMLVK